MKRKTIVLFMIMMIITVLSGCERKKEEDETLKDVETVQTASGAFVSSFTLADHQIYLYQPEDRMLSELINYGYSAPLLIVFGEGKTDRDEAVRLICEEGLDRIAQENGGFVLFVNPLKNWDSEGYGIYEKILAQTAVAQSGYAHGLLYDGENDRYMIFASPAATCLFGYGKGADYLGRHYLKQTEGVSSMTSLGSNDITATGAVLKDLSEQPAIADRNIIIVSLNGDQNINVEAEKQSDHYHVYEGSSAEAFEEYVAGHQRWNGELAEAFYPNRNGILMEPLSFTVNTSADNRVVNEPSYALGAVVFTKENGSNEKKPLLMCFHGGGDTAITTASIAGWPQLAAEDDFILCAIEMHTRTTATETIEVIEQLKELYPVDETRIYATGFSMGGIKTWDLFQEYPEVFAALAPMGATVDVGQNTQFGRSPVVNEDIPVPVIYCGGENSPLGELPFQNWVCINRINDLFRINGIETSFMMNLGNRSEWEDSVYGYEGDIIEQLEDETHPESVTTIRYYQSTDGKIYTALCSISHHQHEIRPFTCRKAWEFMKQFRRMSDGRIIIE